MVQLVDHLLLGLVKIHQKNHIIEAAHVQNILPDVIGLNQEQSSADTFESADAIICLSEKMACPLNSDKEEGQHHLSSLARWSEDQMKMINILTTEVITLPMKLQLIIMQDRDHQSTYRKWNGSGLFRQLFDLMQRFSITGCSSEM